MEGGGRTGSPHSTTLAWALHAGRPGRAPAASATPGRAAKYRHLAVIIHCMPVIDPPGRTAKYCHLAAVIQRFPVIDPPGGGRASPGSAAPGSGRHCCPAPPPPAPAATPPPPRRPIDAAVRGERAWPAARPACVRARGPGDSGPAR